MRVKFTDESYTITAKTALSGKVSHPRNLQIESGRVWLTVEGEPDDHWLSAGDVFALPTHRLIVIEADQQASRVQFNNVKVKAKPAKNFPQCAGKGTLDTCQA